jgi:type IV fimbrial biogenesis protein FimT
VSSLPVIKRTDAGFTLVELLVAIAIIGVLLRIAVPSMSSMISSARLSSQTDLLIGSIALARAEAVKRRAPVTLCPAQNPMNATACAPVSTTSEIAAAKTYWSNGWMLVVGGAVIDRVAASTLLQVDTASVQPQVVFSGTIGSASVASTFKLCVKGQSQQQIDVNLSGSVGKFISTLTCS